MPLTTVSQGLLSTDAQYTGFKNRIINGAMMINQRNLGTTTANISTDDSFITVDRWKTLADQGSGGARTYTLQQSTQKPSGFSNSVLATMGGSGSLPATSGFGLFQPIEGNNLFDFNWGTSAAQPIAVSFWVNCSVTGALPLLILVPDAGFAYYATTYTINAANTWEYKTVTIPGSTAYGFTVNNSAAIQVMFGFGATGAREATVVNSWSNDNPGFRKGGIAGVQRLIQTAGATFYVTGVQLEKGSTATSFDARPYGTELALCQRYFETMYFRQAGYGNGSNSVIFTVPMKVSKRATPTTVIGSDPQTWTLNFPSAATETYDNNSLAIQSGAASVGISRFGAILSISSEL